MGDKSKFDSEQEGLSYAGKANKGYFGSVEGAAAEVTGHSSGVTKAITRTGVVGSAAFGAAKTYNANDEKGFEAGAIQGAASGNLNEHQSGTRHDN